MKKLMLSVAVASALGLLGCDDGTTVADIKAEVIESGSTQLPLSRIAYDPANAIVPVPNDLLFSGTTDGTLNMPGEVVTPGTAINYSDPSTALGALDGWSTSTPMAITVEMADGVSIEPSSVERPDAIKVFEVTLGGPLSPDEQCKTKPSITACKMGAQLTYGVDYVTKLQGDQLVMLPLKPMKSKQGYLVAVTNVVTDSNGLAIAPSSSYESVRIDVEKYPLPLPSQLQLQTLVNSYENALDTVGVDKSLIVYSAAFTTQSTTDVYDTAKLMMMSSTPVLQPFTPTGYTAGQLLAGSGAINPATPAGLAAYVQASAATIYQTTLHAPQYLERPTAQNCRLTMTMSTPTSDNCPELFDRFEAMGDSPVTVLGALQSGVLSMESFGQQYAAQAPKFGRGDFNNNPANLVGMTFTININGKDMPLDSQRHVTKFNPLPKVKSVEAIPVLISVPTDQSAMPSTGWPVVIFQHGITTKKETLLPIAGALANAGVVVVAIDHHLHGDRMGEMTLPDGSVKSLGTTGNNGGATTYLNLQSLLTARDNLRQSQLDLLALRVALNARHSDATINIDPTNVSFYGHSLGAITGIGFVANANTPVLHPATGQQLPDAYGIENAALLAPGVGIPGFLLESASFASLIQNGLTNTSAFTQALYAAAAAQGLTPEQFDDLRQSDLASYQALYTAVYRGFAAQFSFAAQTAVDSGDPLNFATTMANNTKAILVQEVVGDDDQNLPDQTIPNQAVYAPLSGTEPLVSLMGLESVTQTHTDADGVKGIVRFSDGHHSSMFTPALAYGGTTAEGNVKTMTEMQRQLAAFLATSGTMVPVTDSSVVKQ